MISTGRERIGGYKYAQPTAAVGARSMIIAVPSSTASVAPLAGEFL